jgi:hypothetical protein
MFWRAFIGLIGIGVPAAYFTGAFGSSGYDRVVNASPAEVRSALADLDITRAPGAPGSTATSSGDVPLFQLTEQGDDMIWTVTSGNAVAVRMIAHLESVDGGTKTHVTAEVQRGNAPDDAVSPAFRSTSTTLGLFGLVLEDELNDLTRVAGLSVQECRELGQKLLEANAPAINERQGGFAGVAKSSMTLNAIDQELRSKGCDTSFKSFDEPPAGASDMGDSSSETGPHSEAVNFEPGKPMIDPSNAH